MARNVTITWQPLTQWPAGRKRTSYHEDAKFTRVKNEVRTTGGGEVQQVYAGRQRIPLNQTLSDLDSELSHINAKGVVVQIDVAKDRELTRLSDLTNVATPAVVLTFTRNNEPLVFACDHFARWQDNLRAIAKGLESLRLLERYHITQSGEQYRGWKALPSSTGATMSVEVAAILLANYAPLVTAEEVMHNRQKAQQALRSARAKEHPDVGGDAARWHNVELAKRVLEAHHGGGAL